MNIGAIDREITLLAPAAPVQNETGEVVSSYQDMGTAWAGQRFGTGSEAVEADQLTARQLVTWTMRYRADVAPAWRLRYEGRTYHITAVAEIGRRVGLTLTTYYLDNDGQQ